MQITRLLTDKRALEHTELDTTLALAPAAEGEAVLQLQRAALTTNNITYAAFGEAMQYWNFFPTAREGWGHMPVWGFADVVDSRVPGVEPGERFYGYFPLATHLRMQPVRVSERGFYDGAPHRASLVSAYNQYTRVTQDPAYRPEFENHQMLLRPLFITSFMLADFLQDNAFFGAKRLVVSSASSKTAYGTAFCLEGEESVELVGLTSPRNRDYVESLGCYGRTVTYDELTSLDATTSTLYVDFSGDVALRSQIHHHFGDALVHDCYAGSASNTDFLQEADLPGPKPAFYFAPVQIRKRNADWGHAEVNRRFNEAQLAFIRRVGEGSPPWLQVEERRGLAAAQGLIGDLCAGRIDPRVGHVVVI